MVNVRNPKTGKIEEVAAENRFTHFDNNGNSNNITIQSTEQKLDSLREQKSNVGKKNTINPTTGLEWTRKERRAEKRRI